MNIEKMMLDAPDAVIVLDREDRVVYWNRGAVLTFGYEAEEMKGQRLDAIIPEKLRQRHSEAYLAFIRTGISKYEEGHTMAVPAVHKNGERMSIEFRISVEKNEADEIEFVAAVVRDVTEQWKERQERAKRIRELESELKKRTGGDAPRNT